MREFSLLITTILLSLSTILLSSCSTSSPKTLSQHPYKKLNEFQYFLENEIPAPYLKECDALDPLNNNSLISFIYNIHENYRKYNECRIRHSALVRLIEINRKRVMMGIDEEVKK